MRKDLEVGYITSDIGLLLLKDRLFQTLSVSFM